MDTNVFNSLRKLESDERVDLKLILVFLLFVSITRMILETLVGSSDYVTNTNLPTFLLVFTFYGFALVSYTFFLSLCSGKKPMNMARLLTPFLLLALLVPLLDYFITGYPVTYQMSSISDFDILRISSNNPIGESIILWLIPFLSALYVFFERKSIKRSILTFIVIFLVPILLATDIADLLNLGRGLFFLYATTGSIVLLLLMFYMQNEEKFGYLFTRFVRRMNRVILYLIIFFFGIATAGSIFAVNFLGIHVLILLMISFIAMCVDDYYDHPVDRANRKANILDLLTKEDVKNIILVSCVVLIPFLSFIFEGVGSVMFVYYMISLLSLAFLYSYRNFLKTSLFPLNYLVDALSYSITFMAGRSVFVVHAPSEFLYFILVILIFFFLIPMKDYEDYEGDRKFGIKTLYTILGFEKAFKVCKLLLVVALLLTGLLFLLVLPPLSYLEIIIFYVIPSVVLVPFMVIRFRRSEDFETSLWIFDILLVVYLVPLLLL